VSAMKLNYKALFAVLFAVLAFAYLPLLISAQADSSTVLSAVTGLSQQISGVEDNVMLRLNAMNQKLDTLQVATGANIQSLVPTLQAIVGLVAVTLVLCVVNLVLLLRKPKAPQAPKETKEKA
jgi:hypothetical protein